MFGLEIIEVGIGLVFMYLVVSLICSGIVEALVKVTKLRASHLKTALGKLLADPDHTGFVKKLYEHHLIKSPLEDKIGKPTYIEATRFSSAMFDILTEGEESDPYKAIENTIKTIKDEKVRTRLSKLLKDSGERLESLEKQVENWFNESMQDVTDWYRQRMRTFVTVAGVVVVTAFNADTIHVAKALWTDNDQRNATVAAANSYAKSLETRMADAPADSAAKTFGQTIHQIESDIEQTKVMPMGWSCDILPDQKKGDDPVLFWLLKVAGLLMTMGAVSLGSPYWYAQLKSLLNLRFSNLGGGGKSNQPVTVNVNTNSNPGDADNKPADDNGDSGAVG